MLDLTALGVFVGLIALVTAIGFLAARWPPGDLRLIEEWGLGGRRFGLWITWFLLGGDLYTAYTIVAVPAALYATGAAAFFAIPYATLAYPLAYVLLPRLWNVCRRHGYLTAADFVRGRYGNANLALAIAVTGIVATLPYVALQLIGMQVVIAALGITGSGWFADAPLVIAFVALAAYTYSSGLRAPAAIAVVKDVLIYVVIIAAIIVIPLHLGGFASIFAAARRTFRRSACERSRFPRFHHARFGRFVGVRDARTRLGIRIVHVSALGNGCARRRAPRRSCAATRCCCRPIR